MKRLSLAAAASMLGLAYGIAPMTDVQSAELRVIGGGSIAALLNKLGPEFERTSGNKLVMQFNSTPNIIKLITAGPQFDVVVVPNDVFQDAGARARLALSPIDEIASVGYGVAVRAGTPKPNISTSDALKYTLLNAQSVAFLPASAAGAYVLKVFDRLGIGEAMKAKTRPQAAPAQIALAVAKGEADLGVFLINVLIAPGVELVGPFPAELQQELMFTAAVAADTQETVAAEAFINYLETPAAIAMIKAAGINPGKRHTY